MKHTLFTLAAGAVIALSSCSGKLGSLSADNFRVKPNPMAARGGMVPVTVNGTFPEKYMNKKAVVTVTPELRAADGSVLRGMPTTFQGEKVMGNSQTVSYLLGGHYAMKAEFPYTDTYRKSDLWLSFNAYVGKKQVEVPAVKVATGVIATSELYRMAMQQTGGCIAPDTFQRSRKMQQEANVKFLINQAQLRQSEMKSASVREFLQTLRDINDAKEKYVLSGVEVKAYASPEGGQMVNTVLAEKRQTVSEKYVADQLRKIKAQAGVSGEFTAQDWEGFQQLVSASNIQDKDVILRVLSMYQDPEEREEQIRNMSAGFRELADGILPELRRSRLIINYETLGRSDEQIQQQYVTDPAKLSADELLYVATLDGVTDAKAEKIYRETAKLHDKDYRALNNLAVLAMRQGDDAQAQKYLDQALARDSRAAEPKANMALLALKAGNMPKAQELIAQAAGANDYNYALGTYNIAKGNYADAADNLHGQYNNMSALAAILNNDYESARVAFKQIDKKGDGITDYLRAILSARQQNAYAANAYLKDAISKNPKLAYLAEYDLEFAKVK